MPFLDHRHRGVHTKADRDVPAPVVYGCSAPVQEASNQRLAFHPTSSPRRLGVLDADAPIPWTHHPDEVHHPRQLRNIGPFAAVYILETLGGGTMNVSSYPPTGLEHIMARTLLVGLVAACALVGWGCGDEPEPPATAVKPPAEMPKVETPQAETTKLEVPKVEAIKAQVTEALKVEAPKLEVPELPKLDSPDVQALIGQATPLLEQATQYIKANKLDLAKTAIDKLLELKALLPSEWQDKIDAVTTLYNAKKELAGVKLPAF